MELSERLKRMIELEREGTRGNPEREAKAWLEKLSEVDQERLGYLRLATAVFNIIDPVDSDRRK